MENEFDKNEMEDLTGSVPEPEEIKNAIPDAEEAERFAEETAEEVREEVSGTIPEEIAEQAEAHKNAVVPGYTHLQRAQPITFAHYLMAYIQMFGRDMDRLSEAIERTNISPLGSGALAGTTYPLDREFVADELGMKGVTLNSLDGVADRDWAVALASFASFRGDHPLFFSGIQIHRTR